MCGGLCLRGSPKPSKSTITENIYGGKIKSYKQVEFFRKGGGESKGISNDFKYSTIDGQEIIDYIIDKTIK